MNRIPMMRVTLLASAAALVAAGCSSKPKAVTTPESKPVAAAAAPVPVAAPVTNAEPLAEAPVRISVEELNRKGYLKDAFFAYNRYDIQEDQRGTLQKDAAWLADHASVKIVIEGHCDERGTGQYNMALGQQRAQVVRDYLVQLGVDPSRIQIISYGKERPFVTGHDESAWSQNRRDHFVVTAG